MSDAADKAAEGRVTDADRADPEADRVEAGRAAALTPAAWGRGVSLAVAIAVVVADQITKAWALVALDDRDIHIVWTLQFNLAFNTGMAFSRGEGFGPIIGVVALVVVVVLLVRLGRDGGRLATVAVGLVAGGALGNILDRLFRNEGWLRGAVVDFIDFQWFPIFNVADMGITIGGALLILSSLRSAPA